MSSDYVPTVEEVRTDYVLAYADRDSSQLLAGAAFDHFIAKVKADALREAAGDIEDRENCYNDAMSAAYVPGEVGRSNVIHAYEAILEEPYSWLRERADRIEAGEER